MDYIGKIITKSPTTPTGGVLGVASGVWTMQQQAAYQAASIWPVAGYRIIQQFTASGTWTAPTGVTQVEYLVVAGGGGGGYNGGGGGAGGFRTATGLAVTPGTSYTVTVGAGGTGGTSNSGSRTATAGGNSVFSSITSTGGGLTSAALNTGGAGGSGLVVLRYVV